MSIITSELLYHAMRLAGITLMPGNLPSPDQYNDALMSFNRMIGSWNTVRDNIFAQEIDPWTLSANVQYYELGPTAASGIVTTAAGPANMVAFTAVRPQRIERCRLLLQTSPTTVYKEVNVLSGDQWLDKPVLAVTTIPNDVYVDDASPNRNLAFYPIPDHAYAIEFYVWTALAKAALTTTLLDFPDGYELAIVNNLACLLAPMFQRGVPPDVRIAATNTLAAIQGLNARSPRLKTEKGLSRGRGGYYNYLTGQTEA